MNVRLATQLLSSSVANAIDFLRASGDLKFKGSEATVTYIRICDRIFDIFNAKDPRATGFKSPLRLSNKDYWANILKDTREYLMGLQINDQNVLQHRRKMSVLGLVINTYSFEGLAVDLLSSKEPLKYFLLYKCSQDNLEMFFSCIRAQGRGNNNPSALEFRYRIRKLMYRNSIRPSIHANCTDDSFELTPILEYRTAKRSFLPTSSDTIEDSMQFAALIKNLENSVLSEYKNNIVYYIAGFVVRKIIDKLSCKFCHAVLLY